MLANTTVGLWVEVKLFRCFFAGCRRNVKRENSVHYFHSFHILEYPIPVQAAMKHWNKTQKSPASVQEWALPGSIPLLLK